MGPRTVTCAAVLVALLSVQVRAAAEGNDVHVSPGSGGLLAHVTGSAPAVSVGGLSSGASAASGSQSVAQAPPSGFVHASSTLKFDIGTELFDAFCAGANWSPFCSPAAASAATPAIPAAVAAAEAVGAPPTLTPGMVAQAFRSVDLPASELTVQPPNGRTLVNFATNFYTEQGSFTREVRLLGRSVALRIWPSQFAWRFGDGRSLSTRESGAPYPHLEVTHEYLAKGGVTPSVDTTYAAEFSVDGGPWRAVDGTVTIPGEPVRLDVLTATPQLVGYR